MFGFHESGGQPENRRKALFLRWLANALQHRVGIVAAQPVLGL